MASHFANTNADDAQPRTSAGSTGAMPVTLPTLGSEPAPAAATDDVAPDVQLGGAAQRLVSSYDRESLTRVRRKHRSHRWRPVLIGLGIFALAIALVAGAFAYWVSTLDRTMRVDPE